MHPVPGRATGGQMAAHPGLLVLSAMLDPDAWLDADTMVRLVVQGERGEGIWNNIRSAARQRQATPLLPLHCCHCAMLPVKVWEFLVVVSTRAPRRRWVRSQGSSGSPSSRSSRRSRRWVSADTDA